MSWFDRHPDDLAEQSEPTQALAALRAQKQLTPAQLAVLDVFLNHWVLLVLLRPDDREGVLELQQLCELAHDLAQELIKTLTQTQEQTEIQALCARFEAFGDLLEGKRRVLRANEAEQSPKLMHEETILQLVSTQARRQSELLSTLKLSAGRVSQILGVLEAQRKIVRQRKGKESWVSLPAAASRDAAPAHTGAGQLVNVFFRTKDKKELA